MNNNGIPVIKFLFTTEFKVLNEAMGNAHEVEEFSSANDLVTYVSTIPVGLIIVSLQSKNDLVQLATFIKSYKKISKESVLKVVVINFSGEREFEKAIAKLGILDLIEPAINSKALKFKLDFWMKSLSAQVRKNSNSTDQKNVKSLDTKTQEKKEAEVNAPNWLDPLDLEQDIWLIKNESDCKKILSKWLIKLIGPAPFVGQWTEVQNKLWRFEIKEEEKELYVPGDGHWFFQGDTKPDFVWKENSWLIAGDRFDLFFKSGNTISSRLKCKDRVLSVCKNSLYAKTKEQIIIESFNKEMVFKKEAEALKDLEGKGKSDSLSGPLSGKNKTSHLQQGPLSGEVDSSDQLLATDPLAQKTNTEKQSSFWKEKNAYTKETGEGKTAPATGVGSGGPLSGKSSTDEIEAFYGKKKEQKENKSSDPKDPYESLFGGPAVKKDSGSSGQNTERKVDTDFVSQEVLPFPRKEKNAVHEALYTHDPELEEACADARVVSTMFLKDKKIICRLDDFFEETIIFSTHEDGISASTKVDLDMSFQYLNDNTQLRIAGNVTTIEGDGEGNSYVTVQLSKENIEAFDQFMRLYKTRQENVNNFFRRVKGL